jgi:hypothetical protein
MKINPLKTWIGLASAEQQQALADAVSGGSRPYLYHWSNNKREPQADTAAVIEEFTLALHKQDAKLPVVWRVDMVAACGQCSFAKACMAARSKV